MKIVFISDFFSEHILGGGELNNDELIAILRKKNDIKTIQSHLVNESFIRDRGDSFFIVSNFINLSESCKNELLNLNYLIYEHDHKYLKTRNPANYKDFIAPKDQIVNYSFYKNAKAVLCQSQFHCNIVRSNLHLDNIRNLSGNLWSEKSLSLISSIESREKNGKCAVLKSDIQHKNTFEAERYCRVKEIPYGLVSSNSYHSFLSDLGSYSKFIFLPKTPETLSRVVVEARMMGLSIIANKHIGATQENWYHLKGQELINEVMNMREKIPNIVMGCIS
tara:strand:- start:138 stop:971 length:834 start_codon:yes stop_codon:yes gene_type:complete